MESGIGPLSLLKLKLKCVRRCHNPQKEEEEEEDKGPENPLLSRNRDCKLVQLASSSSGNAPVSMLL
jgi:hypothetical protein